MNSKTRTLAALAIVMAFAACGSDDTPPAADDAGLAHPKMGAIINPPLPPGVTGTGTTSDLAAWSSSTALGNYAGASSCSAGSFMTGLSAAGASSCSAAITAGSSLTSGTIPIATGLGAIGNSNLTYGSSEFFASGSLDVTATLFAGNGVIVLSGTTGHIIANGTARTSSNLSSCGTGSPAIAAASSDVAGTITEGTSASGCTLAFAGTFTVAPACLCSGETSGAAAVLVGCHATATTLVIENSAATGDVIQYHCMGLIGST